jgi:hypothetical protein
MGDFTKGINKDKKGAKYDFFLFCLKGPRKAMR